ncbi:MAG: alpha/beta hydrolase [Syntrophales bacterium]|nr:alpha/beta hydrolase [Syntrophales bacterium]
MERVPHVFTAAGRRLYGEIVRPEGSTGFGEGPSLVFLHEGLGSVGQWRDFPEAVCAATGLPALVYDRCGYGRSEPCPYPRTLDYLEREARDSLPEVLAAFHIQAPIFIGHSDGGSIALIFAGIYPARTMAVITEAAHVFVEEVTLAGIREAVHIYETTNLKERLARYHGDKTEAVFRGWSETWLAPWFRTWNIESYLSGITTPLLVIQGEDDAYGTTQQVEAIVRGAKGRTETFLVPRCGHIPHHEARAVVLERMVRFIRHGQGRGSSLPGPPGGPKGN